jgi:hypothetical protein
MKFPERGTKDHIQYSGCDPDRLFYKAVIYILLNLSTSETRWFLLQHIRSTLHSFSITVVISKKDKVILAIAFSVYFNTVQSFLFLLNTVFLYSPSMNTECIVLYETNKNKLFSACTVDLGRNHTIRIKIELRDVAGVVTWKHQSYFLMRF